MGGQNVLSGKVERVVDRVAMLAGGSGHRFSVSVGDTSPAEGETRYFSVRRDRIELAKATEGTTDGVAAVNSVAGTVRMVEYQGTWVKISIELADREEFAVNMADDRFFADPVTEGDKVIARWSADSVHPLMHRAGSSDMARLSGEDFVVAPT